MYNYIDFDFNFTFNKAMKEKVPGDRGDLLSAWMHQILITALYTVIKINRFIIIISQITPRCRDDSDLMPIPSGTRRGRRIDVGPTPILRHRAECVKSISAQLRFDAIAPTRHNRHREEVGKTSETKDFALIRDVIFYTIIHVGRPFPDSL